jgi:hypothetical protein
MEKDYAMPSSSLFQPLLLIEIKPLKEEMSRVLYNTSQGEMFDDLKRYVLFTSDVRLV